MVHTCKNPLIALTYLFCFWLTLIFAGGVMTFSVRPASGDVDPPPLQSGTTVYLQEQFQRLREGKKWISAPALAPDDFWKQTKLHQSQNVSGKPPYTISLDPDRNDSDGDGLRECRVKIDLSGFAESGVYRLEEVEAFEDEMRRVIALYNDALQSVGLEFLETTDGSHHLTIEAAPLQEGYEGVVSLATLFGAWRGDSAVFQIRRDYPHFKALLDMTDEGAPSALYRRPPGNPYAHIFSPGVFRRTNIDGREIFAFAISNVFFREMGHLIGLIDPSIAYMNSAYGIMENYLIDWLASPSIRAIPPSAPSLAYGGEDFSQSHWSGVFMNSFMNADTLYYQIYPDITPPVKAFIAHYYARYNYSGAQELLDQARAEHEQYSWLASGKAIQEIEENGKPTRGMPIFPGQIVLGALSSFDPSTYSMSETIEDAQDWYKIELDENDLGRELVCKIGHATSIERSIRLELYNKQGRLEASSGNGEFAEILYKARFAGLHYLGVKRPSNTFDYLVRDYVLSTYFADEFPSPTPEPTSTQTPIIAPTSTPETTPAPTKTPEPTPTLTSTPESIHIPQNTIIVTDDLQSADDLLGQTDIDRPGEQSLCIRWNIPAENVVDFHIYARTDGGEPAYLGRTGDPTATTFVWSEPPFGHFYSFIVFALIDDSTPARLETDLSVYYSSSERPAPTPTQAPVFFDINPGAIVVTDNLWSSENLIGSFDEDDWNERLLTIRWNIEADGLIDYHIYARINGSDPVYLGRTGDPDVCFFNWTAPSFGEEYVFIVYGLLETQPFVRIEAAGEVAFRQALDAQDIPAAIPTPTPTSTPSQNDDVF